MQFLVGLDGDQELQGALVDVTGCTTAPTPGQMMVAAIKSPVSPTFRRAFLVGKYLQAEVHAVETAYVNRNAKARVFTDRDGAIAWLTSG